jgi:glycerate kinase
MPLEEDLLMQSLDRLHDGQAKLGDGQSQTHTQLAVLETKLVALESNLKTLKGEVRKEARRWGAAGGAAASLTALVIGLLKLVFLPSTGGSR